jgi:hypothetical protein
MVAGRGTRTLVLSADTSDKLKQEATRDPNAVWVQYDMIMFSPLLTVGIDFTMPHFDVMFVFGTCRSCVPRTLVQMTKRIRVLRDGLKVFYHL